MASSRGVKQAREVSAAQAAALVRSGMWIDWGMGLVQPDLFDQALAARRDELTNVKIRSCLSLRPRAVLECDPEGEHFHWFSWHFSGYDRKHHDAGRCNYIPMNFGETPDYYRRFIDPVDMVVLKTAPMDENGFFNFGGAAAYSYATCERAKCVVVEVCEAAPHVYGVENAVHVSQVDYIINEGGGSNPEIKNAPVYRRRGRGWCLPADRHRQHAECGLLDAQGGGGQGSRCPDRNADRWLDRSL